MDRREFLAVAGTALLGTEAVGQSGVPAGWSKKDLEEFMRKHGGQTPDQVRDQEERMNLTVKGSTFESGGSTPTFEIVIPARERKAETASGGVFVVEKQISPKQRVVVEFQTPVRSGSEVIVTEILNSAIRPGQTFKSSRFGYLAYGDNIRFTSGFSFSTETSHTS
jgi:septum formation inhibitor MinC